MNTQHIDIKGSRVHNLKNVSLSIERNKLIVITGLSGSGKSSLAFDTLYAEGQRRYVESLSAYARQFLGKIHKPEVDYIGGIPPAIAIEQKVNTTNPRSTVGTSTEIYDYLKLLYARIGRVISPISGKEVKRHSVNDVVQTILKNEGKKIFITSALRAEIATLTRTLENLQQQGFSRLFVNNEMLRIDDILAQKIAIPLNDSYLLIDRVVSSTEEQARIADSVQTAFYEGNNACVVFIEQKNGNYKRYDFSNDFEADGMQFEEATVHTFSFNSPLGACPECEGFGKIMGIDPKLVIPNESLSVWDDAVMCWRGEKMSEWKMDVVRGAERAKFPIHKPYHELSQEHKDMLWHGCAHFAGIDQFFNMVEENTYKIQYRVMLSRYKGKTTCPVCHGSRLKPQALYVQVAGTSIDKIVQMPINDLVPFFETMQLTAHEEKIAHRIVLEIKSRLGFLQNVGLGYLTLNRLSNSLSGGESQRINLATSLGSSLVGSLYILDEPSIGLHPRDTHLLIGVLRSLQLLGNTVIVVEHDEEIMRAADQIIDIGPGAGSLGGELVFQGTVADLAQATHSLTADYLCGRERIELPAKRKAWSKAISIRGARENNLKNVDVEIPLGVFTVITGVSGSGKSSLIHKILYPAVARELGAASGAEIGRFDSIGGIDQSIFSVEFVDQNPIGRSSRSNPVTYLKAYDEIRKLYAEQPLSKQMGFKPAHFSFNTDGGRCEECQGEGTIHVAMQFMADVELVCEACGGKRFKDEVLEVLCRGKSIFDILELTIDDAIAFFAGDKSSLTQKIVEKIKPLQDVGLGYMKLGQSSSTLSGGESQRVKLASFLSKEGKDQACLFIFDEPTTGLHFHDIHKLLESFKRLIAKGHSIVVIEHNIDVIKCADWIIDIGPEGGDKGGHIVCAGTPEQVCECSDSYTAQFLKGKLR
ncbi:MAG: excinuclease ABC subunit UvrA [Bacteroidales bacterium]|jgi:excinuclease ABC subunit A|nr:excinuclease ABC subunit UvrA [Bacteroidales bacterium]